MTGHPGAGPTAAERTVGLARRRVQGQWLFACILCASTPLLWTLRSSEFLWTDGLEISDRGLIAESFSQFGHALAHGIEGHYYRPTVFGLHTLNFHLFGESPLAFRATNLALHLLNVALIYAVAKLLSGCRGSAAATACLFAIHPLAVTPVSWVSDRTDLLALGSSLSFFLLAERHVASGRRGFLLAAAAALLVGLGAKETPATTVVLTLAIVLATEGHRHRAWLRVLWVQAFMIGSWSLWRLHPTGISALDSHTSLSVFDRVALASYVHLEYARELLIPVELTVCDGRRVPDAVAMYCLAAIALLVALGFWAARLWKQRQAALLLAIIWVVAWMLPTSGILPVKHVRADRYLYGALPALVFMGVTAVRNLVGDGIGGKVRYLAVGLFLATYGYFSVSLLFRASRFTSNEALWTYETKQNDACLEGEAFLGREAYRRRQIAQASLHIDRVLQAPAAVIAFRPTHESRFYRGMIQFSAGDAEGASAEFHRVLDSTASSPLRAETAYSLALIAYTRQDFAAMSRYLDMALALGPNSKSVADVLLLRSYSALRLSRLDECERYYRTYLRERPSNLSAGRRDMTAAIAAALNEAPPP